MTDPLIVARVILDPSAVRTCFRRCADFGGRSRPAEFWWFVLFVLIAFAATRTIDSVLGTEKAGYGLVASTTLVVLLLPLLAVGARRLHDAGLSAGWLLLYLVPCGGIALILFFVRESQDDNRFGPSPLRPAALPASPPVG